MPSAMAVVGSHFLTLHAIRCDGLPAFWREVFYRQVGHLSTVPYALTRVPVCSPRPRTALRRYLVQDDLVGLSGRVHATAYACNGMSATPQRNEGRRQDFERKKLRCDGRFQMHALAPPSKTLITTSTRSLNSLNPWRRIFDSMCDRHGLKCRGNAAVYRPSAAGSELQVANSTAGEHSSQRRLLWEVFS